MNLCVRPRVDVFKVELIIGDTCTLLSFELTIESILGKTVLKKEYRTRLLETFEDFFLST